LQFDVKPRLTLVGSGLYRAASDLAEKSGATGLAVGYAPTSRLTLWAQGDLRFREVGEVTERASTLFTEASFEVYRGVWLRLSPQLRTEFGDSSAGTLRWNVGLNLLPRTHWNVVLSYYWDEDRLSDQTSTTFLAQLHLYL
jgi:hypothetical protein